MSRPARTRRRHVERPVGGDKVVGLLCWLQLGSCSACGRVRYFSRREARYAARLAAPGLRLRAVRCEGFWHLSPPLPPVDAYVGGGADTTAAGAGPLPVGTDPRIGLDQPGRVERRCGRPVDAVGRETGGTPHTVGPRTGPSGGWGATDPLEDIRDIRTPRAVAVRRPHGRRPAAGATGGTP
jgi:hypothetical protein